MNKSLDKFTQLEQLAQGISKCTKCPLSKTRQNAVPGEGDFRASIMFIGEAPGEVEDQTGRPFQGRSGKLLDNLLSEVNMSRQDLFITSSVKCRPPQNRNPHVQELRICRATWLNFQIEILDPEIIVLLGKVALYQLLGKKDKISDLRGSLFRSGKYKYLLSYHPSAALRFPKYYQQMLSDFKLLQV